MKPHVYLFDTSAYHHLVKHPDTALRNSFRMATIQGRLRQLIGHYVHPELWGLAKSGQWELLSTRAEELFWLKTGPLFTGDLPLLARIYPSVAERIAWEQAKGGPLPLREIVEEVFNKTAPLVFASRREDVRAPALAAYEKWKEDPLEKQVREDLKRLTNEDLARYPLHKPQEAVVQLLLEHSYRPCEGQDFRSMPTLWAWGALVIFLLCERKRTGKAPHYKEADNNFFFDSVYADVLVTDDDPLLKRINRMRDLGLADRPPRVSTLAEFLAWFKGSKLGEGLREEDMNG